MTDVNPIDDKKALVIQFLWFLALVGAMSVVAATGVGFQDYFDKIGGADFEVLDFVTDNGSVENEYILIAEGAALAFTFLMGLWAMMAECGFMFIIRSITVLGTLRGRGCYYFFMAFMVAGWGGILGLIAFCITLICALLHIVSGCCIIPSPSGGGDNKRRSLFDNVNPEFTRGTVNFENRISQAFGYEGYDYEEEMY